MILPAILSGFKIQGQTAASAAIGTVTVNYYGDGTWDFTDPEGFLHTYAGDNEHINTLLKLIFVGSGGLPAGTLLGGETV